MADSIRVIRSCRARPDRFRVCDVARLDLVEHRASDRHAWRCGNVPRTIWPFACDVAEDVLCLPCCLSGAEYPRAYEHACSHRWRLSSAYFVLPIRISCISPCSCSTRDGLITVPAGNAVACPSAGIRKLGRLSFRLLFVCRDESSCRASRRRRARPGRCRKCRCSLRPCGRCCRLKSSRRQSFFLVQATISARAPTSGSPRSGSCSGRTSQTHPTSWQSKPFGQRADAQQYAQVESGFYSPSSAARQLRW